MFVEKGGMKQEVMTGMLFPYCRRNQRTEFRPGKKFVVLLRGMRDLNR
jgi:hypothetical protein